MTPKVVNVRTAEPGSYIYVGPSHNSVSPLSVAFFHAGMPGMPGTRSAVYGSPFANPFRASTKGRDWACDEFERWFLAQPDLVARAKRELRGHDLGCWCAPERCHAETLLRVANEDNTEAPDA